MRVLKQPKGAFVWSAPLLHPSGKVWVWCYDSTTQTYDYRLLAQDNPIAIGRAMAFSLSPNALKSAVSAVDCIVNQIGASHANR